MEGPCAPVLVAADGGGEALVEVGTVPHGTERFRSHDADASTKPELSDEELRKLAAKQAAIGRNTFRRWDELVTITSFYPVDRAEMVALVQDPEGHIRIYRVMRAVERMLSLTKES